MFERKTNKNPRKFINKWINMWYYFWKEAEKRGVNYGDRNQKIAQDIFDSWKWMNMWSFWKVTWVNKSNIDSFWVSADDWTNTINDIKSRFWKIKPQEPAITTPKITTPKPTINTPPPVVNTPPPVNEPTSWMSEWEKKQRDNAVNIRNEWLADVKKEHWTAIDDKIDSWNLEKSEFMKNKWYYKNFDIINDKYDKVIDWIRNQIKATWQDLNDAQYQALATRYGVSIDEIKDPNSIYNKLEFTQEWKDKYWITWAEQNIESMWTAYEDRKADLKVQIEWQVENINNQLEDVKRQVEQNVKRLEASGAWSWANKSSWYTQWIDNIKADWQRTVWRIQSMLEKVESANATNVERLTRDYDIAINDAKKKLDNQMWELRTTVGVKINWLSEEYGMSSEWLEKQLEKISKEYGLKSVDIVNSYYGNMKQIDWIINATIDREERLYNMIEQAWNKRYDELLANDWILLQNTSLSELQQEIQNWTLSLEKAQQLQKIVTSSITWTLNWIWTVTTTDLSTIQNLLWKWLTASQIVAKFRESPRFRGEQETWTQDWAKMNDWSIMNKRTWEVKKVWWWSYWNTWWTEQYIDKNIWKTSWWYQYNPKTQRYDIPIWWTWWWWQWNFTDEQLKKAAYDLVRWTLTVNELDNMWYSKEEIVKIEKYRQSKMKNLPDSFIKDPTKRYDWLDKENTSFRKWETYKSYIETNEKLSWLKSNLWNSSWPWDVWMIFWFMKGLDPTSVVRETEYQSALDSLWLMPAVKWKFTKALWEWFIPEDQKQQFIDVVFAMDRIKKDTLLKEIEDLERRWLSRWLVQSDMSNLHWFDENEMKDLNTRYYWDWSWIYERPDNKYNYKSKDWQEYINVPQWTPIDETNANLYRKDVQEKIEANKYDDQDLLDIVEMEDTTTWNKQDLSGF